MHGAHNTCRNACILSAKNAHALGHARLCNDAEASLPWKLLRTYLESCASVVQAVVCRPLCLLSRRNRSPDAVRSKNPSKSTLAHDAVAAACRTSIIRSSALVQASSSLSMGRTPSSSHYRALFSPFFAGFGLPLLWRSCHQTPVPNKPGYQHASLIFSVPRRSPFILRSGAGMLSLHFQSLSITSKKVFEC